MAASSSSWVDDPTKEAKMILTIEDLKVKLLQNFDNLNATLDSVLQIVNSIVSHRRFDTSLGGNGGTMPPNYIIPSRYAASSSSSACDPTYFYTGIPGGSASFYGTSDPTYFYNGTPGIDLSLPIGNPLEVLLGLVAAASRGGSATNSDALLGYIVAASSATSRGSSATISDAPQGFSAALSSATSQGGSATISDAPPGFNAAFSSAASPSGGGAATYTMGGGSYLYDLGYAFSFGVGLMSAMYLLRNYSPQEAYIETSLSYGGATLKLLIKLLRLDAN